MQCEVSLDNITICGSPSDYVLKNLEINPFVKEGWITENQLYHYNFPLMNGGFIQIKHHSDWYKETKRTCRACRGKGKVEGEWCQKCGGSGGKIHVNENGIRIEFNPNNYQSHEAQLALLDILKNCWNPHVTRRDVAFDFYDEKLNDYKILDALSRKQRLYLDRNGKFETLYIGSNQSDLQIRIYNKAIEQNLENTTWWRVEAQMRKTMADTFYFNPFTSLRIKRKLDFSKYDVQTRCVLMCLAEDPSLLDEMSKPTRLKYKKMLMEDVESVELKIADMYDENAQSLYQELESWLNFSKNADRSHRSNMSKPDTILKSDIKHIREIIPLEDGIRRELYGI